MNTTINQFESSQLLAAKLAEKVAAELQAGIQQRGFASLAVSGGSTPKPLFQALSNHDIAWQQVGVTLVDERWVGSHHPDSNARLVRDFLLKNRAAKAYFVSLKSHHDKPDDAEEEVAARVQQLATPFDVVLLGMGTDGHTASFFPGAETLPDALNLESGQTCIAVYPPQAPHPRMTLTLPTLLHTKQLILHIEGDAKWQVLQQARTKNSDAYPVCAVLQQNRVPVDVFYASNSKPNPKGS